jgi:hypothetical protein
MAFRVKFPDHTSETLTTLGSTSRTSNTQSQTQPKLSVGPPGPKGDRGDRGDKGDKGDKGDRGEPGKQQLSNYPVVKHVTEPNTLITALYENIVITKYINIIAKGHGTLTLKLSTGQEFHQNVDSDVLALYQFDVEQVDIPELNQFQILQLFASPNVNQIDVVSPPEEVVDDKEITVVEEEVKEEVKEQSVYI